MHCQCGFSPVSALAFDSWVHVAKSCQVLERSERIKSLSQVHRLAFILRNWNYLPREQRYFLVNKMTCSELCSIIIIIIIIRRNI